MIGMVLFWVLVALAVAWFVRGTPAGPGTSARRDTPLEILDRRYAAGEITDEEYRERRKVLTGRPGS